MNEATVEILFKKGEYQECIGKFNIALASQYTDYELYWIAKSIRAINGSKAALDFVLKYCESSIKLRRLKIQLLSDIGEFTAVIQESIDIGREFPENAIDILFLSFRELTERLQFGTAIQLLDAALINFPERFRPHMSEVAERRDLCLRYAKAISNGTLACDASAALNSFQFLDIDDLPEVDFNGFEKVGGHPDICKLILKPELEAAAANNTKSLAKYLFHGGREVDAPPLPQQKESSILSFNSASLYIEGDVNFIAGIDGKIIREISNPAEAPRYLQAIGRNTAGEQCGAGILIPPLNDLGYFNFVINGLGAILARQSLCVDWPVFSPYPEFPLLHRAKQEIFPDTPIIFPGSGTKTVHFEKLVVPFTEGRNVNKRTLSLFQKWSLSISTDQPTPSRIYISRTLAKNRKLLNETDIEKIAAIWGFTVVHLENMSLSEQVTTFQAAEYILAPHGAGLTNLVFCNNLRCLIEIMPDSYHVRGFENICRAIGANYIGLFGKSMNNGFDSPWTVTESLVEHAVSTYGPLVHWI